jgi:hypothetical protein
LAALGRPRDGPGRTVEWGAVRGRVPNVK